ncbi:MAG TPA: threonine synthase [Limnochordales bacterium]
MTADSAGVTAPSPVVRPQGIVQRYRSWLPLPPDAAPVTLGEGGTPLVRLRRIERLWELPVPLYAKVEGQNPTGSFKDRGMAVAVTLAARDGVRAVVCASTGNTAASAAAYAARAGLAALVVLPAGGVAQGKLAQAMAFGAIVAEVQSGFDRCLELVRELVSRCRVALVNSLNPARLEGQKTAAFEICDELGEAPQFLALPVGNGGNITAYWKGFTEYFRAGRIGQRPRMLGFQAEGAAPLVRGEPVAQPRTVASAIRIGRPARWHEALQARDESGGLIEAVSDEAIVEAQRLLARHEGILCEPASAASLAGVGALARQGYFRDARGCVVCVLTGSGLKDPQAAAALGSAPRQVPAEVEALMELVGERRGS